MTIALAVDRHRRAHLLTALPLRFVVIEERARTPTKPPSDGFSQKSAGLQNRIVDDVSQGYFAFYEPARDRLGAALAHFQGPMTQLLSLAQTWLSVLPATNN